MRILIADTLYEDFIESIPLDLSSTYEAELRKVLGRKFGTFDAYSRNLRALGHECFDVIANHADLQAMWPRRYEQEESLARDIFPAQIQYYGPDVLFLQDLSLKPRFVTRPPVVAAQCSCAFDDACARQCDVIFTSLPTHVPRIEALGVKAVFLPLAFDPIVLEGPQPERDIDISFVGGVGRNAQWKAGTDLLEVVADAFKDRFHWYGYGLDNLSPSSPLRVCYRGPAWGAEMYSIYRRSKIVVNRHGEITGGFANNLRLFEATGCGAMLLTEEAPNLSDLFAPDEVATYFNASDAAYKIKHYLSQDEPRSFIAANGQSRTLRDHTYQKRMLAVSETLKEMLVNA